MRREDENNTDTGPPKKKQYDPGYTTSSESSRNDPVFWNNQGAGYEELGKYDAAIDSYDMATTLDRNYLKAWISKGQLFFKMGNYEEAVRCYDAALEIDGKDHQIWQYKANALDQAGKKEEAMDALNKSRILQGLPPVPSGSEPGTGEGTGQTSPAMQAGAEQQVSRQEPDVTRTHTDNPIIDPAQDMLKTSYLASYLAIRIKENYSPAPSGQLFMVHIYGPWGSGKTSLLNLLGNALENQPVSPQAEKGKSDKKKQNDSPWKIIWFNAWREQYRNPPWLAIMDRIFQENKKDIGRLQQASEYLFRSRTENITYLLTAIITLVVIAAVSQLSLQYMGATQNGFLIAFAESIKAISYVLTFITTIAGICFFAVNFFMAGSVTAMMKQDDITKKERETIKKHVENLVIGITPHIALFIDDLDRCKESYVVDLLEGIQTLFRETPMVIVVAADRRWLYSSYREVYKNFSEGVKEPGRPMEHLFIEKAFQVSVPMPELTDDMRNEYLTYLLKAHPDIDARAREEKELSDKLEKLFGKKKSEPEIYETARIEEDKVDDPQQKMIVRGIAAVQLARISTLQMLEKDPRLLKFSPDLESNPRAMKRFVNAWDVNRNLNIMLNLRIDHDQLALWTILMMRWPRLARYLHDHPETFGFIGNIENAGSAVDREFHDIFMDENVIRIAGRIDDGVMKKCIGLCA